MRPCENNGRLRALLGWVPFLCLAAPCLSAEWPVFEYRAEGKITLWGEELDRDEALQRVVAARKWCADAVLALSRLGEPDGSPIADRVSLAREALALMPELPEMLDQPLFDAMVQVSTALWYYPPERPRDRYDVHFTGYGAVSAVSTTRKDCFAVEGTGWRGWCDSCYGGPRSGDMVLVLRGAEEVAKGIVYSVMGERRPERRPEEDPGRIPKLRILCKQADASPESARPAKGDTVIIVRPIPEPGYRRRMDRLRTYYNDHDPVD